MKATKRSAKYSEWYETTDWRNGWARTYITKAYTEYHDLLHQQARKGGYQAKTIKYQKLEYWPHLYGEEIRTTNRGKFKSLK